MERQPHDPSAPARARVSALARLLILYPPAWRERYGDELGELLAGETATPGAVAAVLAGALDAHLHPRAAVPGALSVRGERRRLAALGVLCACVGAVVTALFFAEAMRELAWARLTQAHPDLRACWFLLLAGAALAALAALSGGGPLLVAAAREAARRRRGELRLLLVPPLALLLSAGAGAAEGLGGWETHVPARLELGVDVGLQALFAVAVALGTGAICLAVLRSDVTDRMVRRALAAGAPGTLGIGATLAAAFVWLVGAHRAAPALFRDRLVAAGLVTLILLLLVAGMLAARGVVRGLTG